MSVFRIFDWTVILLYRLGPFFTTYSVIRHTDDPGIAADHEEDEAEERHIPSAKEKDTKR